MKSDSIKVISVNGRKHQKAFMQFAWDHYRGDANWVPPIRDSQKELLNFKHHPFYDNAEIESFLAYENDKPVGRISAIIDHGHNREHKEKRGMFGFFESIDDQTVANALFEAATKWIRGKDMNCVRGPISPALNHECGLLVNNFDMPPTFLMTYNKPYYEKLITTYGFQQSQDLFSYVGHIDMLDGLDPKLQFVVDEAKKRFDIKTRRIERKNFDVDVKHFLRIYNLALPGTWGFVPLTDSELTHMAKGLKHLIVPEMTTMAEVDGKVIGAVFGMLDYNPIIKKIDGRLFPFGFLKLLFGRKKLKRVRLVSTNVVPEFQRWGVGLVLMNRLVADIKEWGIETGEFSWVLESNKLSRQTLERSGALLEKTHRIYDMELV